MGGERDIKHYTQVNEVIKEATRHRQYKHRQYKHHNINTTT